MNVRNYRLVFLDQIFRHLLLPPVIVHLLLRLTGCVLTNIVWTLLLALAIPCAIFFRVQYENFVQGRNATRLGAEMIPRVKGRYPGNIDIMLAIAKSIASGYVGEAMEHLFEEYGCTTLNARILWNDLILSKDEAHVKYVLSTGFVKFEKGFWHGVRRQGLFGNGIFNTDGETWKMHRAMARPFFVRDRISDFKTFEHHTHITLDILHNITASGPERGAVDVQDLFSRFSMDASCEFLFGEAAHTLKQPMPIAGSARMGPTGSFSQYEDAFVEGFEESKLRVLTRMGQAGLWPLFELRKDWAKEKMAVVRDYATSIYQRVRAEKGERAARGEKKTMDEMTMIEHLVDETDDEEIIIDQVVNILLAGRDTTASLLTFTIYLLARHPDVFDQLREEAIRVCGPDGVPTPESIRALTYMRAVLNESLRIFPPIAQNMRSCCSEDAVLPSSVHSRPQAPLYVPPKADFLYFPILMQRRKDLWGDDAEDFKPERWIDQKSVARFVANPMMFVPFHAGPRICLGQQFAYNEASLFMVRLLQQFRAVTLAPECQPAGSAIPDSWKSATGRKAYEKCWPSFAITLFARGGLWVRFEEAT